MIVSKWLLNWQSDYNLPSFQSYHFLEGNNTPVPWMFSTCLDCSSTKPIYQGPCGRNRQRSEARSGKLTGPSGHRREPMLRLSFCHLDNEVEKGLGKLRPVEEVLTKEQNWEEKVAKGRWGEGGRAFYTGRTKAFLRRQRRMERKESPLLGQQGTGESLTWDRLWRA